MRRLPIYVERALGELEGTRNFTSVEFERGLREEGPVSCHEGCAHCCHYPIMITVAEGILLYRHLASKGKWTPALRKKLAEHADHTSFADQAIWLLANIPCPLLDEKQKCSAYAARPLSCRLTWSSKDPEGCRPHEFNAGNMASRTNVMQVSAAYEDGLLRRARVSSIRMPISKAVQIAERVLSGELSPDRIELAVYEDFSKEAEV